MDIKRSGLKAIKYLQDIDRDDVLEAIGLQQRSSVWSTALGTFGIFALGALVGVGFGLAFAPKAGIDLRDEIGEKVRRKANELAPTDENKGYTGSTRSPST